MKFTNLVLIIKKYRYLLTIIFVIGIFICFSFSLGKNYDSQQPDLSVSNENEEVIEEKTTSDSLDQTREEAGGKVIEFKLPDGNVLSVDENRITEFYGSASEEFFFWYGFQTGVCDCYDWRAGYSYRR